MNLKFLAKVAVKTIQKNAPLILGMVAAGTSVAATIVCAKETKEAEKAIIKEQETADHELTKAEKVAVAAPHYWKTIVLTSVSAGCSIASGALGQNIAKGYLAASGLLAKSLNDYKAAVRETYGMEGEAQVEIARLHKELDEIREKHGDAINKNVYIESYTGTAFVATPQEVETAMHLLNQKLWAGQYWPGGGEPSLQDFFDYLPNAPKVYGAQHLGWSNYGFAQRGYEDIFIDKDVIDLEEYIDQDDNGNQLVTKEFRFILPPRPDFYDDWIWDNELNHSTISPDRLEGCDFDPTYEESIRILENSPGIQM